MIKHYRIVSLRCVFILVVGLTIWPSGWFPRAFENVTLVSFTADSLPGSPVIYFEWETATEIDTAGFFIGRSATSTGPFTRVGEYTPAEGDGVTGAQYYAFDDTAVMNEVYYYRLEVLNTNQTLDYHGPIRAVAGTPATEVPPASATPTASYTPTRTPTSTPTATATPTTHANKVATNPTAASNNVMVATPRLVTGATITPRPTSATNSSNPVVSTVTPLPAPNGTDAQLPAPFATSVPSVLDAVTLPTAVPPLPAQAPPAQDVAASAPAPTLVPPDALPAVAAPVVIATEAAPTPASADTTTSGPLLLVIAAALFLGLAFVILRQARQ